LNKENHDKIKIKVIDYNEVLGASIDRQQNTDIGLQRMKFGLDKLIHVKAYLPTNWRELKDIGLSL